MKKGTQVSLCLIHVDVWQNPGFPGAQTVKNLPALQEMQV